MSAVRLAAGVYVDPHTRQPYAPRIPTWIESAPVEMRKATPEELRASRPPSARRPRTEITLPRRVQPKGLYLAHLSDTDVLEAVTGRSQEAAAALLRCSQSSIARRLRQIRAGITASEEETTAPIADTHIHAS